MAMQWKGLIGLVKETASGWYGSESFQLGAALAFYGAFALAPILVIAIAMAGVLFGQDAAEGQLAASLETALGLAVGRALVETLTHVHFSGSGWTATWIGLGLVLFGATPMFIQLQAALNAIWGVQPKPGSGLWAMIRGRFLAFVLVLAFGALLVLLLIANAVLAAVHGFLPTASWSGDSYLWEGVHWLLLLGLLTLLFAMIYKLLPDAIIAWRDVWVGAAITAVLFALGNYFIGFYLGRMAPGFTYGAASSIMVVMLWVYYSSQVLLFGAELTKNFTQRYGKPVRPAEYATYVSLRAPSAAAPAVDPLTDTKMGEGQC
jgi:membrane protein